MEAVSINSFREKDHKQIDIDWVTYLKRLLGNGLDERGFKLDPQLKSLELDN